jgi:hypothetical protein
MLGDVRTLPLAIALCVAAGCKTGGEYVETTRMGGADRGDTNGRSFDFVSTKPDGDEWTIRFRGDAMSVFYSMDDKSDDLGSFNLTAKESRKLWNLVDELNLPGRRSGFIDDDEGTVLFRLREPAGEDEHEIYTVYVSRTTEDEAVIDIAEYLRTIVSRHTKEKPNF